MTKKLEVGVTKIAEVTVLDPETREQKSVPLFYGNHIEIGNVLGMVPKKQYLDSLDAFFNSSEGQEYERPDEEQIESDIELLHKHKSNKKISKELEEEKPAASEPSLKKQVSSEKVKKQLIKKQPNKMREAISSMFTDENQVNLEDRPQSSSEKEPINQDQIKMPEISKEDHFSEDDAADQEATEIQVEKLSENNNRKRRNHKMIHKYPFEQVVKEEVVTNDSESEMDATAELTEILGKEVTEVPSKHESTVEKEIVTKKLIVKDTRQLWFFRILSLFLLTTCIVLGLGLMDIIPLKPAENSTFKVLTLAKDVSKGSKFTKDDFVETEIPVSEYEKKSANTYIDKEGTAKNDTIMLSSNLNNIEGKYAATDLKQGDYLKESSYSALSSSDEQTVQLQLDDGTTVEVKAADIDAGKSTVHMYAIISSSDESGKVTNTAIDMGEISFKGKALTDVLNQQGISLITSKQDD